MTFRSDSISPDASAQKHGIVVHVYGRTDVGRTREHNEDAFAVAEVGRTTPEQLAGTRTLPVPERGLIFMVADGMGGAAAGELASAMAVDSVIEELHALPLPDAQSPDSFATSLRIATESANARIHTFAVEHPENRGMGTTATVAGLLGDTLYLAQVGDSRAYLIRDGVVRQITKDQSLMQKLVEAGEITEEQAEQSERRNIILQALGPEATVKIDLTHQKVRRGDTLILCSDGLSGQVRAEEIGRVVRDEPNLMALCERLIDRANETGGPDNITVVAARFDGDGLPLSSNGDEVGHRVFATAQEREQGVSYEQLVDTREIPSVKPAPVISAPERESREAVARRWVTLVAIMALLAIGVLLWEKFAA